MVTLSVNGKSQPLDVEPDTPLLYVLRDKLALRGPKFGCGLAQCGACTVLVDGKAVRSCVVPVSKVRPGGQDRHPRGPGHAREAPSGAAGLHRGAGRPVRLLHQRHGDADRGLPRAPAGQSLRARDPRARSRNNLCRCGTHQRILAAVKRAAALMGKGA